MAKYNRLTALEDELTKVAGSTTGVVNSRLSRLPSDVYKETYLMSAYGIDPAKASLAVIPKKAVESVALNPLDKIARNTLAQTTREGIRRSLVQGVMQGQSYPDMAKSLKKVYEVSAKKALVIARTEGQRAMAEGQRDIMDKAQSMGIKIRLFWDAYLDSRTRDNHAFMNGREAEEHNGELMFYYEPTGQWVTGPMDPSLPAEDVINCFPAGNIVYAEGLERIYKRYYEGRILVIKTAKGSEFTVTVNHPILTPQGWVKAGLLTVGSDVISLDLCDKGSISKPKKYNIPTDIAKLYSLCDVVPKTKRVSFADYQFHGDIFNSDVYIKTLNCKLRDTMKSSFFKKGHKLNFSIANILHGGLSGLSSLFKLTLFSFFTTNGIMSFFRKFKSFFSRRVSHSNVHCFTSVSNRVPHFNEKSSDNISADIISRCKAFYGSSGEISTDNIIGIFEHEFSGHVYNLQTESDMYSVLGKSNNGNSIIVHNCRCTVRQELADEPVGQGQTMSYDEWKRQR